MRQYAFVACAALFVSGIDPGYINDVVPLLLSGLCQEIEEIRAFEIFNYELYAQPEAVRYLVGFGQPLDDVPPMVAPGVPTMVWGGQVRLIARGLGLALDEIREVLGSDRPASADVRVVGRDVCEPLGRAVRHQDDRPAHETRASTVCSCTSAASSVSTAGSV